MYLEIEENKSGWKKIDANESIDLGEYKNISNPEDWIKGTEKAVSTILGRIDASEKVRKRAEILLQRVNEKQDEFSGKSRLSIASAVVYFALEEDADEKEITKVGSISTASLKNMIETMSNTVELN